MTVIDPFSFVFQRASRVLREEDMSSNCVVF